MNAGRPLSADDARDLLLVRAFEAPPVAPWTEADARWASEQAQRAEGADVRDAQWLTRRAGIALERLSGREPQVPAWRRQAAGPRGLLAACVGGAFVLGVASDAIGPAQRIDILAPPLMLVLAWNLVVYAVLLVGALRRAPAAEGLGGPLRSAVARLARLTRQVSTKAHPALSRFAADWGTAARPLAGARLAQALHAGAAALAAGALASLYLRGLAFEFRAGWDSTFLTTEAVAALLRAVLGPASWLSGLPLPDAAQLEALRWSTGGGENAARFIHLDAITLGAVVVLPRLLLALAAGWRARRLARHFPLPLDDPYFTRLLRAHRDAPALVQVLPYSYHLPLTCEPGLAALLDRVWGPKLAVRTAQPLALGAEDTPGHLLPQGDGTLPDVVVALLPLTATPERETHGAFLDALMRVKPAAARGVLLLDESAFLQRLGSAPDAEGRRAQRRRAWERLVHDLAAPQPPSVLFVDLASPDLDAAEAQLLAPAAPPASAVAERAR